MNKNLNRKIRVRFNSSNSDFIVNDMKRSNGYLYEKKNRKPNEQYKR